MADFERWFQKQGAPAAPAAPSLADQLEDIGLDLHADGSVWGNCCMCGGRIRLTDYLTVQQCLTDVDPENEYCGGSPRCCPMNDFPDTSEDDATSAFASHTFWLSLLAYLAVVAGVSTLACYLARSPL